MKQRWFTGLDDEKLLTLLVSLVVLGGASIAGVMATRDLPSSAEPLRAVPATKADVEQTVATADALMPNLKVTSKPLPIIERRTTGTVMTYLVEAEKTNENWFPVTDYQIHAADWTSLGADKLHEALNRAYVKNTSFSDEIKATLGVTLGKDPVSISGAVEAPIQSIGEALGLLHGLENLNVARIDIAIKGYADGEVTPTWTPQPLREGFHAFPVLHSSDESKDHWLFYDDAEHQRVISSPYRNDDLPDLRARYLQTQLVEWLVPRSQNAERCHVYVLHNKAFPQPNEPSWRKAEIWVMVYLEGESS